MYSKAPVPTGNGAINLLNSVSGVEYISGRIYAHLAAWHGDFTACVQSGVWTCCSSVQTNTVYIQLYRTNKRASNITIYLTSLLHTKVIQNVSESSSFAIIFRPWAIRLPSLFYSLCFWIPLVLPSEFQCCLLLPGQVAPAAGWEKTAHNFWIVYLFRLLLYVLQQRQIGDKGAWYTRLNEFYVL